MATKTTRWSPDHCPCVLEFTWDDSVSQDLRTHTPSAAVRACSPHSSLLGQLSNHYSTVLAENQRKNKVYAQVLSMPGLTQTVTDPSTGSTSTVPSSGVWNYSFDPITRVLTVTLGGAATATQKTNLQNWCTTNLGLNLVLVQ